MNTISVVVPLFNERDTLLILYEEIVAVFADSRRDFEIVFVDDGSRDGSYDVLLELAGSDKRVRVVRLRRNFGKSAALAAGFRYVRGEIVVTLDADLQDRPREIPGLLEKLEQGCDLVSGWRRNRRDPLIKRISSRIFNALTSRLTGVGLSDINCGLKAYRRDVIEEIRVYGEMHRYIPVLASYRGFVVGEIEVEHQERRHGRSKYGTGRMFGFLFDLLTVIMLTRYNKKPLHIFGILGALLFSVGFVILGYLSVQWFSGLPIAGRPLFMLGILLMIVGVQFVFFGLMAEMIAYSSRKDEEYSIDRVIEPTSTDLHPAPPRAVEHR